jgi:hypothetical protein
MDTVIAYDYSTYNIGILDIIYGINDVVKYKTLHNNKVHTSRIRYNLQGEAYFNSVHRRIYFNTCMRTNMYKLVQRARCPASPAGKVSS